MLADAGGPAPPAVHAGQDVGQAAHPRALRAQPARVEDRRAEAPADHPGQGERRPRADDPVLREPGRLLEAAHAVLEALGVAAGNGGVRWPSFCRRSGEGREDRRGQLLVAGRTGLKSTLRQTNQAARVHAASRLSVREAHLLAGRGQERGASSVPIRRSRSNGRRPLRSRTSTIAGQPDARGARAASSRAARRGELVARGDRGEVESAVGTRRPRRHRGRGEIVVDTPEAQELDDEAPRAVSRQRADLGPGRGRHGRDRGRRRRADAAARPIGAPA